MIDKIASWKFAEEYARESDAIVAARRRANELGVEAITPATGQQLAFLATALGAKSIVEVGTGAGVSGLWLLSGSKNSVLTTIDSEPEFQNAARESFKAAGIPATRMRVISGKASEVLANMAESAYDLVFVDIDPINIETTVAKALGLIRPGGVLAIAHSLWRDRVPNPTLRDDETSSLRAVMRNFLELEDYVSTVSMVGDGLLLVAKKA
jgi:predicted O-methyltransferase YrrM